MTIQELAIEMNQSEADVISFVNCLKVWTSKGYSIEESISKHMGQMERLATSCTHPALKAIAVDTYDQLNAEVA